MDWTGTGPCHKGAGLIMTNKFILMVVKSYNSPTNFLVENWRLWQHYQDVPLPIVLAPNENGPLE
jgi:hypothetical protein